MKIEATDRRRHPRAGLFGQIEDVTYRVLRRAEIASEAEADELGEYVDDAGMPAVNVTFGQSEREPLGEPF